MLVKVEHYEALVGDNIEETCEEMVSIARRHSCHVKIMFNGVELFATPFTTTKHIIDYFYKKLHKKQNTKE